MNLRRLYHTLKHLKPIQIKYQIRHRLFPVRKELKFLSESTKAPPTKKLNFTPWIEKQVSFTKDCTFEFLNNKKTFENGQINWQEESFGKLWTYNLNYMDYLLQLDMSKETGLQLIKDFIRELPFNKVGIEPYPISLRGINWIKFLSKHNINDEEINRPLWIQYKILLKRPEYHLLGNHLLENGFSLLFAAFYFGEKSIYNQAKKNLFTELKKQILQDGGHFELSPMYHQIILGRLLDCINLIKNNQRFGNQNDLLSFLIEKAQKMLGWINLITFSNNEIPLLNDAAPDIAPDTKKLNDYASLLNLKLETQNSKLSSSGYRRFNGLNYEVIIDVGQIGPSYQPGHVHADTFNFVLNVNSRPFIVDTGISTYDAGKTRLNERGTAAHNTVTVQDKNSSEVWSSFRVGRRAEVKILKENDNSVMAEHNGYRTLKTTHQRQWNFSESEITITDTVFGKVKEGKAHLWLSPELKPIQNGESIEVKNALFNFENAVSINLFPTEIPSGFMCFSKTYKIEIRFKDHLKTIITTI